MIRRDFFKGLAAILVAPSLLTKLKFWRPKYIDKEYALSFIVSQEMIEDDIYGIMIDGR